MAGAWDRVLLPPSPDVVGLLQGRQLLRSHRPRPADELDQVTWLDDAGEQQETKQLRLRSIESVDQLYVRFFNNTPFEVRMLWLDYRGNEVPYELIGPGQSVYQHTFLTHPWLVREVSTGSRLLLNQQEAFVASELPPPVQPAPAAAAEAPAGEPAAAEEAAEAATDEEAEEEEEEEGDSTTEWETDEEGQEQEEEQEFDHSAAVAAVAAILVLTGVAAPAQAGPPVINGMPVLNATITPLPSLAWSKESHHLFSEPFKAAVRTFLLCHQQLQRTAGGGAGSGSHLGHLHHHLLPHVFAHAAPMAPQAVHYPLQHRPDILPVSIKGDCWSRVHMGSAADSA